jgi:uncharacterized protein DUF5994
MRTAAERATTIILSLFSPPRLLVRPPGPPRTLLARTPLDGGWWPRSADPARELPGLILAIDGIDDRHGPITRVMLRAADWDSHPRRLRIDSPGPVGARAGRIVRLGWSDTMPAGLLAATCTDGRRTDLLTVPPHTSPAAARAAMELAAHPGNFLCTPDILSAINTPNTRADRPDADTGSENAWEGEGGSLRDTSDI